MVVKVPVRLRMARNPYFRKIGSSNIGERQQVTENWSNYLTLKFKVLIFFSVFTAGYNLKNKIYFKMRYLISPKDGKSMRHGIQMNEWYFRYVCHIYQVESL